MRLEQGEPAAGPWRETPVETLVHLLVADPPDVPWQG